MELTKEQINIVNSDCKINVALSVPGSGKTSVLILRAKRLVNNQEPVLICTFSRKTAEEIITRVGNDPLIDVRTIHSLCFQIVKENWKLLGDLIKVDKWPAEPIICDRSKELELVQELGLSSLASSSNLFQDFRQFYLPPDVMNRLAKRGVYFKGIDKREIAKWANYEQDRIGRGIINFDDMVYLAESILSLPEVSLSFSDKYDHILIDEAQDTSSSQWAVLRPLVLKSQTTIAVGDYNQSIYGFRNADGSVLLNLANHPDSVIFRLSNCFRVSNTVAELANNVVKDLSSQIIVNRFIQGVTQIKKFDKRSEELDWVVNNIQPDTAILSRTNFYLEPFERKVIEQGIPYVGKDFYRSSLILEVINDLNGKPECDWPLIVKRNFQESIRYDDFEKDCAKVMLNVIQELGLATVSILVDKAQTLYGNDLFLGTGHSSKGLEWNTVHIVGAHYNHIPHRLATDMREERNLLYVMATRAKDNLHISYINALSPFLKDQQSSI